MPKNKNCLQTCDRCLAMAIKFTTMQSVVVIRKSSIEVHAFRKDDVTFYTKHHFSLLLIKTNNVHEILENCVFVYIIFSITLTEFG